MTCSESGAPENCVVLKRKYNQTSTSKYNKDDSVCSKKRKCSEGNGSNQRTECKLLLKRKCKQTSNTKFYSDGIVSSKKFKYNESSMSNQNIAANYTSHVNDDRISEECSAKKSKNHKQQFCADIMKSLRAK